ncbi:Panacea domain-containing protein [Corynebacterium camporealensis]
MTTSVTIAQVIYDRLGWVSSWKLQKLTYYCQAWSLGWFGRPLFSEDFQAWKDGPVEPALFRVNKFERDGLVSPQLPRATVELLDPWAVDVIDSVLDFYGGMDNHELIERTHSEQPWKEARGDVGPNVRSNDIVSKSSMKRFYSMAEARRMDGPQRPSLPVRQLSDDELQAKLDATTARWSEALEILADR